MTRVFLGLPGFGGVNSPSRAGLIKIWDLLAQISFWWKEAYLYAEQALLFGALPGRV